MVALLMVLTAMPPVWASAAPDLLLWYAQPANDKKHLEEALPLGNGRMGCLLSGGVDRERIQFNEQSLWSGDNNWDGAYETGDHGFGSSRNFGELIVTWKAADALAVPRITGAP